MTRRSTWGRLLAVTLAAVALGAPTADRPRPSPPARWWSGWWPSR